MSTHKTITSVLVGAVTLMSFSVVVLALNLHRESDQMNTLDSDGTMTLKVSDQDSNTGQEDPQSPASPKDIEELPKTDQENNRKSELLGEKTSDGLDILSYSDSQFPDLNIYYPANWEIRTSEEKTDYGNLMKQTVKIMKGYTTITYELEPLQNNQCTQNVSSEPLLASIQDTRIRRYDITSNGVGDFYAAGDQSSDFCPMNAGFVVAHSQNDVEYNNSLESMNMGDMLDSKTPYLLSVQVAGVQHVCDGDETVAKTLESLKPIKEAI